MPDICKCGGNRSIRGVGACHCGQAHNEPKPLKYVWVRWSRSKWRAIEIDEIHWWLSQMHSNKPNGRHYVPHACGAMDLSLWTHDLEFTADTPPPGDCCKRCTERMEQ